MNIIPPAWFDVPGFTWEELPKNARIAASQAQLARSLDQQAKKNQSTTFALSMHSKNSSRPELGCLQ